jgi:hypothetical protein
MFGCAAYMANRWVLKPHIHSAFFHGYFNDLLLIPCALPPVLWLHRRLGLRKHDDPPRTSEVLFHLAVWSALFEWIGPHLVRHATGDPLDVAAYGAGAGFALIYWRISRLRFALPPEKA